MITSSGAQCDVCGKYILPLDPFERVNIFKLEQAPDTDLHCHNACKDVILQCNGDWKSLLTGPLRKLFEEQEIEYNKI